MISTQSNELNEKVNLLRQEIGKFEDYKIYQKNLQENIKREYENLKLKVLYIFQMILSLDIFLPFFLYKFEKLEYYFCMIV